MAVRYVNRKIGDNHFCDIFNISMFVLSGNYLCFFEVEMY